MKRLKLLFIGLCLTVISKLGVTLSKRSPHPDGEPAKAAAPVRAETNQLSRMPDGMNFRHDAP